MSGAGEDGTPMAGPRAFRSRFTGRNARWLPGAVLEFLATGEETGGAFALFEARGLPGMEPPPHLHTREDETYYLLAGELSFTVGERTFRATRGDFVFLPRGVRHAFRVESESFHVLVGLYPAGLEQMFVEMTVPAEDDGIPPVPEGPPSPAEAAAIAALFERYGVLL